jgi:hypothetical protein
MVTLFSSFDFEKVAGMRRNNLPGSIPTLHHSTESGMFLLLRTEALYSKRKCNLLWVKSPGWLCLRRAYLCLYFMNEQNEWVCQ